MVEALPEVAPAEDETEPAAPALNAADASGEEGRGADGGEDKREAAGGGTQAGAAPEAQGTDETPDPGKENSGHAGGGPEDGKGAGGGRRDEGGDESRQKILTPRERAPVHSPERLRQKGIPEELMSHAAVLRSGKLVA